MSTQRRESRWRTGCTESARDSGMIFSGVATRHTGADAISGTAPPVTSARLATNSLHLGYRIVELVQDVCQEVRPVSPPSGAGPGAATGTSAIHGSSPPHIPSPSDYAHIPLTLPRVPAG